MILIILAFVVGVVLGGYIFFKLILNAYATDRTHMISLLDKTITDVDNAVNAELLSIEKCDDNILVSFAKNGRFIAQGKSLQEALDNTRTRYPNITFKYKTDIEDI
jgi:hypothetical protein